MKDLHKTSECEITNCARNDLEYQIVMLAAEKNLAISENIALRSKVDLLESQLKSREETIKLQAAMFAKEKKTIECRKQLEIMHQLPSCRRVKSLKLQVEQQASVTNIFESQIANSTRIKLEPGCIEYNTQGTFRKHQLPFIPQPSNPKTSLFMQKKRKTFAADDKWTLPPRLGKKPKLTAPLKEKPSRREENRTNSYRRRNKWVLSLKGKVLSCFRQLPDQSSNVTDVISYVRRNFGDIPTSSIRSTVSILTTDGMLEKLDRDENKLTIYRLTKLAEEKSKIAKPQA